MAKNFVLKNNLTKDTLLKIATTTVIAFAVISSPYFLHKLAKYYFNEKTKEMLRKRARKLRELQKKQLIEFKELANGSIKIVFTQRGKKLIRQYKLEDMVIQKPKQWDKKWRVIIYDIPKYQQKASDAFRNKLRDLGLYQLQKSVWVSPYECLAEIEFLCGVFDIDLNDRVYHFKTAEIPQEAEIKKFFGL